jgi:aquaporin Z
MIFFTQASFASLFVIAVIGTEASLGATAPEYSYPLPLIFAVEAIAAAFI